MRVVRQIARRGQIVDDRLERFAEVRRDVDVGRVIAVPVIVERDVERRRVEVRRLDAAHIRPRRNTGKVTSQILPRAAVICGQPDIAVVRAREQQSRPHRRLRQRHDRAVRLGAGHIGRDTAGGVHGDADLHRIFRGQIRRNRIEIFAAARRLHHLVRAGIERLGIVGRDEEWRIPVPAQIDVRRVGALAQPQFLDTAALRRGLGPRRIGALDDDRVFELRVAGPIIRFLQGDALAGREVQARHVATLRLDVDDARVDRILRGVEAVAAADGGPIGVGNLALPPPRRAAPGAVVLEAGTDVVREAHVVTDDVGLSDWERVQEFPIAAFVPCLRHAAVVADDHVTGIGGIDPHRVMVDVNADRRVADRLAAVIGKVERRRRPVDAIRVLGVDTHL